MPDARFQNEPPVGSFELILFVSHLSHKMWLMIGKSLPSPLSRVGYPLLAPELHVNP